MLVLSRKSNEGITIECAGQRIRIIVIGLYGDKVRLGFDADKSIPIHRDEVYQSIQAQVREERGNAESN